jgi:hypothetical protein
MNSGEGLIVGDGTDPDATGPERWPGYAVMPPSTAKTAPVV